MPDDDLNRLVSDKRIIRNVQKIKAVRENALYFMDLAQEHGSEAGCFANWPSDDFIGLLADMKKKRQPLGRHEIAILFKHAGPRCVYFIGCYN